MENVKPVTGLPPLAWLKAFESAARTLSFASAATELNLSTGAISYQIRTLEANLGFALFTRMPRGIKLTPLGAAYLPAVRKAFDELADSTAALFGGAKRVKVTLHAPASLAALWLAKQLPAFMAAHTGIDIRLSSLVWDNVTPEDNTDLEIRYGSGHWDGYRAERLLHQDLSVVCSPTILEQAKASGEAGTFMQHHLIPIVGYEKHRLSMQQALGIADLLTCSAPTVDTSIAALELASSDGGCVLAHRVMAEPYLRSARLVIGLDREFTDDDSYFLCTPQRRNHTRRHVELFRAWLIDIAAAVT
jgi:LysR family transcriptional regulator, glycine cleavage system transcriptional activator